MSKLEILKRLYQDYTKKFITSILGAIFFAILVAGSTSSIAWLLDPAIKKIFIDKDQTLIMLIPILIVVALQQKVFSIHGKITDDYCR